MKCARDEIEFSTGMTKLLAYLTEKISRGDESGKPEKIRILLL